MSADRKFVIVMLVTIAFLDGFGGTIIMDYPQILSMNILFGLFLFFGSLAAVSAAILIWERDESWNSQPKHIELEDDRDVWRMSGGTPKRPDCHRPGKVCPHPQMCQEYGCAQDYPDTETLDIPTDNRYSNK